LTLIETWRNQAHGGMIQTTSSSDMSKIFKEEIFKLFNRLKSGKNFSFSKYADGEWAAINNEQLNNNEFVNSNDISQFFRDKLIESIRFKHPDYIIGTCCPCCNGVNANKMREFSGQQEGNMTFANIFVNANYQAYKDTFLREYAGRDIHLVANEKSKIENLPFKVEKFYPVQKNAWVNNYQLINEINEKCHSGKLFLFCAGPFGNLLSHQLFDCNKNNTYIDIGSTLNPWLQSEGFARDYYSGGSAFSGRICTW
jgi:hypothetical protein